MNRVIITLRQPPAQCAPASLHTPAVRASDVEQGFVLMEDLGDRLYLPELDAGFAGQITEAAAQGQVLRYIAEIKDGRAAVGMRAVPADSCADTVPMAALTIRRCFLPACASTFLMK